MTTIKTIAEQISDTYDNDGQNWTDANGIDLTDTVEDQATTIHRGEHGTRYEFGDGSAIVTTGGGWDLGFSGHDLDCTCWPDANSGLHQDGCSLA